MSFNVARWKAEGLKRGGARPNQFKVQLILPFASPSEQRVEFMCRATQIPGSIIEPVRAYYFGRSIKFGGDREIQDWTLTFYNDEDFPHRSMFENWHNKMNAMVSNIMDEEVFPVNYKSDGIVYQYGKNGQIVKSWRIVGAWPIFMDPIPLDWENVNQIQTFDVTMSLDWWEPEQHGPTDQWNPSVGTISS